MDSSFNSMGKVTTASVTDIITTKLNAVVSDGSFYYAAGPDNTTGNAGFVSYMPSGAFNGNFQTSGTLSWDAGGLYSPIVITGLHLQNTTTLAAFGYATDAVFGRLIALSATLSTTGTTAPTGNFYTAIPNNTTIYSMQPLDNGKYLIAGNNYATASAINFFVAQLNSDLTLDTTFNADETPGYKIIQVGEVVAIVSSTSPQANSVLVQSDNKIILAGQAQSNGHSVVAAVRLNADGSLDNSYGTDGVALITIGKNDNYGFAMQGAIQSNNKVVLGCKIQTASGGTTYDALAVIRLTTQGVVDPQFSFIYSVGNTNENPNIGVTAVAIQSDGKILAAGTMKVQFATNATVLRLLVFRLLPNGELDITFGTNGCATIGNTIVQPELDMLVSDTNNGLLTGITLSAAALFIEEGYIIIAGQVPTLNTNTTPYSYQDAGGLIRLTNPSVTIPMSPIQRAVQAAAY